VATTSIALDGGKAVATQAADSGSHVKTVIAAGNTILSLQHDNPAPNAPKWESAPDCPFAPTGECQQSGISEAACLKTGVSMHGCCLGPCGSSKQHVVARVLLCMSTAHVEHASEVVTQHGTQPCWHPHLVDNSTHCWPLSLQTGNMQDDMCASCIHPNPNHITRELVMVGDLLFLLLSTCSCQQQERQERPSVVVAQWCFMCLQGTRLRPVGHRTSLP